MSKLDSRHIDEIAALLAIDAMHSFVAAGKIVERHPTIISKRIASLEVRLGVRLVERTTRQVQLTDVGKRLADKLRVATDLINEAQQEATETAEDIRGCLKLGLSEFLCKRGFKSHLRNAFLELDSKSSQRSFPIPDWHCPFLADIA